MKNNQNEIYSVLFKPYSEPIENELEKIEIINYNYERIFTSKIHKSLYQELGDWDFYDEGNLYGFTCEYQHLHLLINVILENFRLHDISVRSLNQE